MDEHTKARCQAHIAAKPRVREEDGYFNDDGKFVFGPVYRLILDGPVSIDTAPGFIPECGAYISSFHAKQAAEHIREWCRKRGVTSPLPDTDKEGT